MCPGRIPAGSMGETGTSPAAPIVFLNGRWVPEKEALIPANDRGFLLGDAVFETLRLYRGAYFRFDEHYRRLVGGAAVLRIPVPSRDAVADIARGLARRNRIRDGSLRITVTRGPGGRGLGTRGAGPPTVVATLRPLGADWEAEVERGWAIITARTPHPAPGAMPARVKSQNRLHAILARLEAEDVNADDALLLSPEGFVAEGPTWNIFWRAGQRLQTPALDLGILPGITRAVISEIAPDLGFPVEEGRWPRFALEQADELFATLSSFGPVALRSLDGRPLDPPRFQALPLLRRRYWERVAAECDLPV